MKSAILIATIPARGHIFPTLAVAAELVRRGHRVTYLTTAEFAETISGAGVTPLLYESVNPADAVGTEGEILAFLEENQRFLRVAEERREELRPDALLYDSPMALAGRILAKTWGLPGTELTPVFASNDAYSYMEHALRASGLVQVPDVTGPFEEYARRAAELFAKYGIEAAPHESPLGDDELNVVYVPRAFQPKGETFGERFAFVGPCLGERAFLGDWQPPASGLPVVLASLGTTYNDRPEFFRMCAEAFVDQPWHLVMSVGQKVDPAQFGPLPDNVEMRRWVPHLTVLEHAQVFVTHGGMGSVLEGLYQGVPMVLVPSWPDIHAIADRAAELGLGQVIRPEEVTAERLRDAVSALARDSATAERVRRMRQVTREAGGASRAADEIEAHLKRAA